MTFGDWWHRFQIEEITLTGRSLSAGVAPLRFALLSDLHIHTFRAHHHRLVEAVNSRRLDFVFLAGDYLCFRHTPWEVFGRLARAFECRHGVFACRGNWELKCGVRAAVLKELMGGWGVRLLINESLVVETGAGRVRIGGLDDLGRGWPDFCGVVEDGGADYGILLAHAPLAARFIGGGAGYNLVLSGHTHGGQIRIPLLWQLALPSCHGGFYKGLYRLDGSHLYVSRGFGARGALPLRFRCPAEVAFFEVRPG